MKIDLDNWFIDENTLSISLNNFLVNISFSEKGNLILSVLDDYFDELLLSVDSLEEAITFTEQVINNCKNNSDVEAKFMEHINNKRMNVSCNRVDLSIEDIDEAILDYLEFGKDFISVKNNYNINNGKLDVNYSLVEHLNYDGVEGEFEILLTQNDVSNALANYLDTYDYDLVDYKYMGGPTKVGHYYDDNNPHYDGVRIKVKKK